MRVLFVRHGKDDDRYRGGWSDLDLIPEGIEQARKLAKHLKVNEHDYKITQIITSDLQRTMTTAHILSEELHLSIQKDARLREINNGDLAGMRNDVVLEQYPGMFFGTLEMEEAYPNGESPKEFYQRIKTWFSEFCNRCNGLEGNVLIVTHEGVLNIIHHIIKGIEWNNKNNLFKVANCSLHVLNMEAMEFEVENRTDYLNDIKGI